VGYVGHEMFSHEDVLSYPREIPKFFSRKDYLAACASDAKEPKAGDPNDGVKHYIEIDQHHHLILTGTFPQNFDSISFTLWTDIN